MSILTTFYPTTPYRRPFWMVISPESALPTEDPFCFTVTWMCPMFVFDETAPNV